MPITKHTARKAHGNALAPGVTPMTAMVSPASTHTAGTNASMPTIAWSIGPVSAVTAASDTPNASPRANRMATVPPNAIVR